MSIQLKISPKLIKNIADLYNDTNRIFMEYIDNALDSAEKYYVPNENRYQKSITITLKIIGSSYKDGTVTIEDNCTGISNITKVVQKIGDSDKSGQFTTNGQFGFGMYSFMAACGELAIYSKFENEVCKHLPIKRKQFDSADIDQVSFPDPMFSKQLKQSGTKIILSQIYKSFSKHAMIL